MGNGKNRKKKRLDTHRSETSVCELLKLINCFLSLRTTYICMYVYAYECACACVRFRIHAWINLHLCKQISEQSEKTLIGMNEGMATDTKTSNGRMKRKA